MTTLYKLQDGQLLIITGHLNKHEINMYKHEGYRKDNPLINKSGIRVARWSN